MNSILIPLLAITLAAPGGPTEIARLGTEDSRTYDNGDGTYTCEIQCAPDSIRIDSLAPLSSGTAYRYMLHGYWFYATTEPEITYYQDGYHPWIEFRLGAIPDTAHVTAVSLLFYQYEHNGTPRTHLVNSHVSLRGSSPQGLYDWLSYGLSITFPKNHAADSWVEHRLHPTGLIAFDSCLVSDYLLLAIVAEGNGGGDAYGRGELFPPYLRVTYELSGMSEPRPPVSLPLRATATVFGRTHDLRFDNRNLQSDIALLDASGRRVLNLHPGPNDISHLAPGVYFMRGLEPDFIARVVIAR